MRDFFLNVPSRGTKPRQNGLTLLLDAGMSTQRFIDVIRSHHVLIDFVKFGWGTALVTAELEKKIECLKALNIGYFFGGTLFEKALHQKKLDEYYAYLKRYDCKYAEISNGTIDLSNAEKCKYIAQFAREFYVFSEVGYKDSVKSESMYPAKWVECIMQDLAAGAKKVITESRESGQSGICRPNGELRYGLIEEIVEAVKNLDEIVFEAPTKTLQAYFIKRLGPNVNLGNIAFDDVVGLETLRLSLRSDTFFLPDQK
nr:phosphosulfolactate synthase [Nitrospirota bacterium]